MSKNLEQKPLSFEEVDACLSYSPVTGEFTWKYRPPEHFKTYKSYATTNGRCAGKPAGYIDKDEGYIRIEIFGCAYKAHRLAWLLSTGKWPLDQLDHKDHDRTNNRIENLCEATQMTNLHNKKLYDNNTSGYCGVTLRGNRFRATVRTNGKRHNLGTFDTAEEADAAARAFREQNDFHENHGAILQ